MWKGFGRIVAVLWTLICVIAWFKGWPQPDNFWPRLQSFFDLALLWAFPFALISIGKWTVAWIREGFTK